MFIRLKFYTNQTELALLWVNAERVIGQSFLLSMGFSFLTRKSLDYNVTFKTAANYWLGISLLVDGRKLSPLSSKEHIVKLASELKRQAEERQIDRIVFYGPSPKMMKCYLAVLHYALMTAQMVMAGRN